MDQKISRRTAILFGTAAIAVALSGCAPKTALRGNLPREHHIEQIKVGQSTKADVEALLGSPSALGTFDANTWYYMSRKTEQWAFLNETVVDQQVVAMHFDEAGVLQHMDMYTAEDSRDIAFSGRETPTAGRRLGFFEQMFGNLGNFGRTTNY